MLAKTAVTLGKAKELVSREVRELLGEYDAENVFWRSLYALGIYGLTSIVWRIWKLIGPVAVVAIGGPPSVVEDIWTDESIELMYQWLAVNKPDVDVDMWKTTFIIIRNRDKRAHNVYEGVAIGLAREAYEGAVGLPSGTIISEIAGLGELGKYVDTFLIEKFPYVLLGIPSFFVAMEGRRVAKVTGDKKYNALMILPLVIGFSALTAPTLEEEEEEEEVEDEEVIVMADCKTCTPLLGVKKGDPSYLAGCDVNQDGVIDEGDLFFICAKKPEW